uniref:Uncharacterized protein n=1 Tax=Arundo donax TaxID=35708 RepID=A0A0A9FKN8_ARUDO
MLCVVSVRHHWR